jgi:trimethylamine:corrinoid methyltransferase-like protein
MKKALWREGKMTKKIKSITNPKLSLEILTPAEVKKIHDATMWIIEKVGV